VVNLALVRIAEMMPEWLVARLRANTAARNFVRRWTQGRARRMTTGVGAGLWFIAGLSNPAYAVGDNELPVQRWLAQHLQPGATLYDIGGNVGFFTVLGAKLVGPTGHVYVFEPVPENAATIRHNLAMNEFRNVIVFENAVARVGGNVALNVAEYSGGAVLASAGKPPDHKETIMVRSVAIDELIEQGQVKAPQVVKIDVEGAELDVLQGMAQTLARDTPLIIYEIDDGAEAAFRAKCEACEQFLHRAGYQVTPLEDSYPMTDWIVGHFVAAPKK
jgi:FkbM family methyltransferase